MTGFILADLRRLWAGSIVILLLIAFATALGVAVTLQERALRLGSARAADTFDLVVGAPGSETQLLLSSVFLQPSPLPLMPGNVLSNFPPIRVSPGRHRSVSEIPSPAIRSSARPRRLPAISRPWRKGGSLRVPVKPSSVLP